jgi:hypothetical protein
MIRPVALETLLDGFQIENRVGEQPFIGQPFQRLAFYFEAVLCQKHQPVQPAKKFILGLRKVSDAGHIDGNHANAAG